MLRSPVSWIVVAILLLASPAPAADVAAARVKGEMIDESAADPTESAAAAEQRRAIEEFTKAQALERGNLAAVREQAAFREVRSIAAPAAAGQVLAFAPLPDGGLVIATGPAERYGETSVVGAVASLLGLAGKKPHAAPGKQLIWLDASGAALKSASLPFACKGLTVAADGAIVAVGDDRVVVFSAAGEQVGEATSPHFQPTAEEQAALEEELAEQHREQAEMRREQRDRFVQAKADLEAIPEEERTPRQVQELAVATATASAYEASVTADQQTPEAAVAALLAEARTIHRVAASREHLFLVAREPVGYSYGVWRCGRDFSAPEKIIGGLRGCCGQMDVQVVGDELVIPENGRHQVAVYGFDGAVRRTFGEASRTDFRAGFGGCCNPMNACPGPDGTMLLSESNGLVKQFAADGTLVDILGAADVPSGCKNSSIGLSSDGTTLYYLDVQQGRVLVLEKKS